MKKKLTKKQSDNLLKGVKKVKTKHINKLGPYKIGCTDDEFYYSG